MSYIRRSELKNYPQAITESLRNFAENATQKTAMAEITVFLSHSHEDDDLVEQARIFLGAHGVKLYVDWKDPDMPPVTTPGTAEELRTKIRECEKFVLLASDSALRSRWVPWELGFADPTKGMTNIAVLPVASDNGTWRGSEYVGAYPKIAKSENQNWIVVPAEEDEEVRRLSHWFRQ